MACTVALVMRYRTSSVVAMLLTLAVVLVGGTQTSSLSFAAGAGPSATPGGSDVSTTSPRHPEAYPWIVTFKYKGGVEKKQCYGALVSRYYVLTSARCLHGTIPDTVFFQYDPDRSGMSLSLHARVLHGSYLQGSAANDLGLLILSKGTLVEHPLMAGAFDPEKLYVPVLSSSSQIAYHPLREMVGAAVTPKLGFDRRTMAAVVSDNPTSQRCPLHSGLPVLRSDGGRPAVVGIIGDPGSCSTTDPATVALLQPHRAWLAQAVRCSSQHMKLSSLPRVTGNGHGCNFSALNRKR